MNKIFTLTIIFFCSIISFSQDIVWTPQKVVSAVFFDKTPPLIDMPIILPGKIERDWKEQVIPNKDGVKKFKKKIENPYNFGGDPSIQDYMGIIEIDSPPIKNWDGVNNINGVLPPDTQGDVGPNHYIQMVNLSFQIWDKDGNSVYGPVDNSTLWDGFGDPWDGTNDGDPIILYDETADRWMFTQFALPNYPSGPFYILIAITESGDPLGTWYRYGFEFDDMPDYPKFGVWPDGYYMTINEFASGSLSWAGVGVAAFERDLMLVGDPNARMIYWDLSSSDDPYSMLPSDFDGAPPPAGTPNYMLYMNDDIWGYTTDHLRIFECSVDWVTTSNSTLSGPLILDTDPFDYRFSSHLGRSRANIPQPGNNRWLDALSSRVMFRLQYRNFGNYQTLVTNHTVDVNRSTTDHAGIRWYELRDNGSGWTIHQQGTYVPDAHHRWMGSTAMDGYGNIALGYSVSSNTVYPSIRYVGRYGDDPLGQLNITEQSIIGGGGSQSHTAHRWGDYSMMSVDPIDYATFWFTTEYIQTSGSAPWRTRIASFTFGFDLNIKAFLEGPYASGSSMSTNLNAGGYLPILQPFNSSPWNYSGIEKVVSNFFTSNASIVDWVLIELRTGTSASTIVAQRAGLLRNDGIIVGLDGVSPLRFGLPAGNYYIVVHQRNHLSIMSGSTVTINSYPPAVTYDFTTAMTQAYTTGPDPMIDLGGGIFGMIGGDSSSDNFIDGDDFIGPDNERFQSGYLESDTNMDAFVDGDDLLPPDNNRVKGTQVPN
jgi:hypothetical protein